MESEGYLTALCINMIVGTKLLIVIDTWVHGLVPNCEFCWGGGVGIMGFP